MTTPPIGVKPMLVSMLRPWCTAAGLDPLPRCISTILPAASAAPARRSSSSKQVGVRQPVEAVATDALGVVGLRDRQAACDVGQAGVEGGVEAEELRHAGPGVADPLDQPDFLGQVVGCKGHDPPERVEQFVRDQSRRRQRGAAVDDAVPDAGERRGPEVALDLLEQPRDGRRVRGIGDGAAAHGRRRRPEREQPELEAR